MLKNQTKKITITANSSITVTDGDTTKEVLVEGYTCKIDSDNPQNMEITRFFTTNDMKAVYKDNRETCRADYAAFENAMFDLQDELIAAKE